MQKPMPATIKFKAAVKKLIAEGSTPSEAVHSAIHGDIPTYVAMLKEANFSDAQIVANVSNKQNWHTPSKTMFDRPRR